jgi:4-hydroxy-tetrahydrodipicolinate synthase
VRKVSTKFHGIFIIPCTPFTQNAGLLTVDEPSLRNLVKYIVNAGAHGIVMPQLASEFYTLSEHERHRITDILVEEVNHRIPVIIGVQATNTQLAVQYATYADEHGADGVIALPPYLPTGGEERIFSYFQQISDSIEIPIFIQNGGPPMGSSLTPTFIARMVKEIDHVHYVKEEVVPTTHSITADLEACGTAIHGVFGGFGGRYLLEELTRGAVGNMPTCEYTEIVVNVYRHFIRGELEPARELHKELMALQSINRFGLHAVKEVLRRRGIIQTNYTRIPSKPLDQYDSQEIEQNLQRAQKYLLPH